MSTATLGPLDETITVADLTRDPYPIYKRLRREAPVLRVKSVGRTFLTKAADTKYVKDNAALFSSNDPNTPMKRAFLAHTLMRKDHDEHRTERMAMMPALMPKTIESVWAPLYAKLAAAYLDRLPRGEVVDLFPALAGPLAGRMLAHAMGVPDASDEDMQRWSQTLIDGAGNFGWTPGPFQATDIANAEMDKCIRANAKRVRAEPDSSALSFMVNAEDSYSGKPDDRQCKNRDRRRHQRAARRPADDPLACSPIPISSTPCARTANGAPPSRKGCGGWRQSRRVHGSLWRTRRFAAVSSRRATP